MPLSPPTNPFPVAQIPYPLLIERDDAGNYVVSCPFNETAFGVESFATMPLLTAWMHVNEPTAAAV